MREEAESFFTKEEEQQIVAAIKKAESRTSGEIRVHLENHTNKDNIQRAKEVFEEVGMTATEQRNGVLFYLAVKDHKFSILGDKGINDAVPKGFWDDIKEHMQQHFKQGNFADGMAEGITMAGKALQEYFPYMRDDDNELPDEISKS